MEGVSLSAGAFYLLATIAVVGAAGVAFSKNIIYSALSLMMSILPSWLMSTNCILWLG